jgi:hypothetical protein
VKPGLALGTLPLPLNLPFVVIITATIGTQKPTRRLSASRAKNESSLSVASLLIGVLFFLASIDSHLATSIRSRSPRDMQPCREACFKRRQVIAVDRQRALYVVRLEDGKSPTARARMRKAVVEFSANWRYEQAIRTGSSKIHKIDSAKWTALIGWKHFTGFVI